MADGSPGARQQPERLFADFVDRRQRGETIDIDAFCAEHPDHAAKLRLLHAEFERIQSGLPAAEQAAEDAERAVHTSGETASDAAWLKFLEQLKSRGPAHSRYVRKGELARGGMGVIHRVFDTDVRRPLAMKVILGKGDSSSTGQTPAVDSRKLGRFLEEAQVTGQLDHPGIVPVHELGVDDQGQVYFTMKLVKGEDLRSVFDRVHDPNDDGWNPTRTLSLLLRACEALAYAHDKGVVHRDLKPANIMVGKYGETYVMDWGLARLVGKEDEKDFRIRPQCQDPLLTSAEVQTHRKDDSDASPDSPLITMDGDVVGTPAYMPPEQAAGKLEEVGPASDVYAMGAMLYHLLSGHMPYVPPGVVLSQRGIWARVQEGPPASLDQVAGKAPAELMAICEKAMAREIKDRYPDMMALARDLRAYLENRVVSAYESGPIAELRKWVKRNKALAATAAAALLAVLVLSGWALVERQTARANEMTAVAQKDRADENATLADRRAEEAEAEKQRVLRLADGKRLSDLKKRMDALWPADPERAGAMEAWLAEARALVANLAVHEQTLEELRSRGTPLPHPREAERAELRRQVAEMAEKLVTTEVGEERTALEGDLTAMEARMKTLTSTIDRERPYQFADEEDAWWHETLVSLVSGLAGFMEEDRYGATVENVEARLEFARTIRQRSIEDPQAEWDEAIASIADPEECPHYDGLVIQEQLGLVPIGRDPDSGLWEFWHVQTGERPERDEDGALVMTEAAGVVFVLIPGGTFWMGAQKTDPEGPNYDPQAESIESDKEGNPVEVVLDPYFLSKYEMTQGQWEGFVGRNPSFYNPGNYRLSWSRERRPGDRTHPVEQVSWEDCGRELGRLGLVLPTEAQWEFGSRAGTDAPWWPGREKQELETAANLADAWAKEHGGAFGAWDEDLDDGRTCHAPVGSYRANGFGLHDVHGNVWEWCRDGYGSYDRPTAEGDGERPVQGDSPRANRSGSYGLRARFARSAHRSWNAPVYRNNDLGCRPARVCED